MITRFTHDYPYRLKPLLQHSNKSKPVGIEALAGRPAATTFNGAPTPTG